MKSTAAKRPATIPLRRTHKAAVSLWPDRAVQVILHPARRHTTTRS